MRLTAGLLVGALGLASACVIPFTSVGLPRPDPLIATQYDPPAAYDQWWAVAESCAHKTKNLRHWKWYSVKPELLRSPGLTYERNEVYVRDDRILDRTEVLTKMVGLLTPNLPFSGTGDEKFFRRTLSCVGITMPTGAIRDRPAFGDRLAVTLRQRQP